MKGRLSSFDAFLSRSDVVSPLKVFKTFRWLLGLFRVSVASIAKGKRIREQMSKFEVRQNAEHKLRQGQDGSSGDGGWKRDRRDR